MSKRKPKHLTTDQVIDYIYEHKADYAWVNRKMAHFNHKRLDDYISEFIVGYLSASKSNQLKFETTEDLGKYLTQSMANRVRTAFRGVARHSNFINQSKEMFHIGSSETYGIRKFSEFETIEELIDLQVIARKTWRPAVAEENLKIIMNAPDTKDMAVIEAWYNKRKALIIRLYKTYRKKFKQKKDISFVNTSAAAGIIEGCVDQHTMKYPQKRNGRSQTMKGHEISFENLVRASEIAGRQAENIRTRMDRSGFFKRLTSGGIVTNKERTELEKKNKLNELVAISKRVESFVNEGKKPFDDFDSQVVKRFVELSGELQILSANTIGAKAA